eukprot:CAMPEP_0194114278 /NCGR_PEP_ID=MMETSP0150-20130528/19621_1 /TAXON_ID=122233 /ORGANISM="Chaetoceros debilis, Strain MM31A-1" /LENGTH=148 /DNA_ID=CAMNT_0038804427 /DNA_START=24 /DNA_END=473 /DNA_ORIENTATION=+
MDIVPLRSSLLGLCIFFALPVSILAFHSPPPQLCQFQCQCQCGRLRSTGSLRSATRSHLFLGAMKNDPEWSLPPPPPPAQPFVHYSYATKKDFPICRPHSKSLADILGTENVEILEMAGVEGHFDSHFALADPTSEWHDALTKTLSSI